MNEHEQATAGAQPPTAHQPQSAREAPVPNRRRYQLVPVAPRGVPHTRPGDQNALCLETDQA